MSSLPRLGSGNKWPSSASLSSAVGPSGFTPFLTANNNAAANNNSMSNNNINSAGGLNPTNPNNPSRGGSTLSSANGAIGHGSITRMLFECRVLRRRLCEAERDVWDALRLSNVIEDERLDVFEETWYNSVNSQVDALRAFNSPKDFANAVCDAVLAKSNEITRVALMRSVFEAMFKLLSTTEMQRWEVSDKNLTPEITPRQASLNNHNTNNINNNNQTNNNREGLSKSNSSGVSGKEWSATQLQLQQQQQQQQQQQHQHHPQPTNVYLSGVTTYDSTNNSGVALLGPGGIPMGLPRKDSSSSGSGSKKSGGGGGNNNSGMSIINSTSINESATTSGVFAQNNSNSSKRLRHVVQHTTSAVINETEVERSLNQFILLQPIGSGTQGTVYLGIDTFSNEFRAIKEVFRPSPGASSIRAHLAAHRVLERLKAEVEIMKLVQHPHLVTLYEVIDDPASNNVYLVLNYIDHGPVAEMNTDGTSSSSITLPRVARYIRQISSALAFLHEHGVIHKDIKPENILLGNDDNVFLSDFGISEMIHRTAEAPPTAAEIRAAQLEVSAMQQDGGVLQMSSADWTSSGSPMKSAASGGGAAAAAAAGALGGAVNSSSSYMNVINSSANMHVTSSTTLSSQGSGMVSSRTPFASSAASPVVNPIGSASSCESLYFGGGAASGGADNINIDVAQVNVNRGDSGSSACSSTIFDPNNNNNDMRGVGVGRFPAFRQSPSMAQQQGFDHEANDTAVSMSRTLPPVSNTTLAGCTSAAFGSCHGADDDDDESNNNNNVGVSVGAAVNRMPFHYVPPPEAVAGAANAASASADRNAPLITTEFSGGVSSSQRLSVSQRMSGSDASMTDLVFFNNSLLAYSSAGAGSGAGSGAGASFMNGSLTGPAAAASMNASLTAPAAAVAAPVHEFDALLSSESNAFSDLRDLQITISNLNKIVSNNNNNNPDNNNNNNNNYDQHLRSVSPESAAVSLTVYPFPVHSNQYKFNAIPSGVFGVSLFAPLSSSTAQTPPTISPVITPRRAAASGGGMGNNSSSAAAATAAAAAAHRRASVGSTLTPSVTEPAFGHRYVSVNDLSVHKSAAASLPASGAASGAADAASGYSSYNNSLIEIPAVATTSTHAGAAAAASTMMVSNSRSKRGSVLLHLMSDAPPAARAVASRRNSMAASMSVLSDHQLPRSASQAKLRSTFTSFVQPTGKNLRTLRQHAQDAGADVGTRAFMAPEILKMGEAGYEEPRDQVARFKLFAKADVWSLGVTVYVLIYGTLPFPTFGGQQHFFDCVCDTEFKIEFPDRTPGGQRVPSSLRHAVQGMLSREASARWSAKHVKEVFRQLDYESEGWVDPDQMPSRVMMRKSARHLREQARSMLTLNHTRSSSGAPAAASAAAAAAAATVGVVASPPLSARAASSSSLSPHVISFVPTTDALESPTRAGSGGGGNATGNGAAAAAELTGIGTESSSASLGSTQTGSPPAAGSSMFLSNAIASRRMSDAFDSNAAVAAHGAMTASSSNSPKSHSNSNSVSRRESAPIICVTATDSGILLGEQQNPFNSSSMHGQSRTSTALGGGSLSVTGHSSCATAAPSMSGLVISNMLQFENDDAPGGNILADERLSSLPERHGGERALRGSTLKGGTTGIDVRRAQCVPDSFSQIEHFLDTTTAATASTNSASSCPAPGTGPPFRRATRTAGGSNVTANPSADTPTDTNFTVSGPNIIMDDDADDVDLGGNNKNNNNKDDDDDDDELNDEVSEQLANLGPSASSVYTSEGNLSRMRVPPQRGGSLYSTATSGGGGGASANGGGGTIGAGGVNAHSSSHSQASGGGRTSCSSGMQETAIGLTSPPGSDLTSALLQQQSEHPGVFGSFGSAVMAKARQDTAARVGSEAGSSSSSSISNSNSHKHAAPHRNDVSEASPKFASDSDEER